MDFSGRGWEDLIPRTATTSTSTSITAGRTWGAMNVTGRTRGIEEVGGSEDEGQNGSKKPMAESKRLQEGSTAPRETTNVCSVCFNVDIVKRPSKIEEAHAA